MSSDDNFSSQDSSDHFDDQENANQDQNNANNASNINNTNNADNANNDQEEANQGNRNNENSSANSAMNRSPDDDHNFSEGEAEKASGNADLSSDNQTDSDGLLDAEEDQNEFQDRTTLMHIDTSGNALVPQIGADGQLYLPDGTKLVQLPIEDEMKGSYLTYAMSVIISRAIPDARDGLKPSQRRILVAMNDLGLNPNSARFKCAKICGNASGDYHPHGEQIVYPTLVRMAQEWNLRHVLIDKQGNFGSIAGLPAAAMRYTEARLSSVAMAMLEDLTLDTVDFIPNYDETKFEPVVLPSKFPNLLVNGANGIAVGMATSIPPHNLGEICDATIAVIDNPNISPFELFRICPGPDFPTGGIICGSSGIRRGYLTGRGNITVRARARIEEHGKRSRIIVSEIPFQQARDRVEEKIADMVNEGKIVGISAIRNESDLKEPVRLILELKRDADPDIVLNQLYQFTPLQDTFSIIMLALVDGKPRILTFKEMIEEFIRHRVSVIRRRTQFLLNKAIRRQHTVEGLLIAHANIDEVIRVIRTSKTQIEAKERLMQIECPSAMLHRILGEDGFSAFQAIRGLAESYSLTPVQADAILKMTLGHLVNLEQEKLADEYRALLDDIANYRRILADEQIILGMVRDDLNEIKGKFNDKRRTEINGQELSEIDLEDLINEETMVVSISTNGYIKRTALDAYKAQRRGGKGLIGVKANEEDPIRHMFVASTHAYLLFFTNQGKVYWHKVYNIPQYERGGSKGRNIVNLLNLDADEKIADCRAIKDFDLPGHFLIMATKSGLVKKTNLAAYRRPLKSGLIAIKLKEGDELIDVGICGPNDEIVLSTAKGKAIRFRQSDVRPMGRNASGVKGISLKKGDHVVGMVLADEEATLLTVCENGYGKRTPFGPNAPILDSESSFDDSDSENLDDDLDNIAEDSISENDVLEEENRKGNWDDDSKESSEEDENPDSVNSSRMYRIQHRGGGGIIDIKTTKRNGQVMGILRVYEEDELMMITAHGKIQRIAVSDVPIVGRNTQGVRIMNLDDDDILVAINRIPKEDAESSSITNADELAKTDLDNNGGQRDN
ncbi:MAG: DNA gyrase subunit A [Planctomycetia bacterium]|nr:DNA gyrase subunit A [Planctomycetia bacterium]